MNGMTRPLQVAALTVVLGAIGLAETIRGADWPTWRHDAARSGDSSESLPAKLALQWVRQLPPPQPAWPDEPRLAFDWTYEPVVAGRTIFVPSSVNDSVTAFDLEMGHERWRFYAQGPVRFPAVADRGRVYFVSDDGYLYCVEGSSGGLLWKFRGGPDERRVLGNGRLISAWPARGGPVVAGGRVYFAAGLWPSQGVFVHALDSATGRVVWTNDGSGSRETEQPHGGVVPNGPSPQGCLVLAGDKLLVPCGRTYPAVFDARDGRLLAYQMGQREEVGCQVVAAGGYFFCGASAALSEKGSFELLHRDGYRLPVIGGGTIFHAVGGRSESAVPPAFAARMLFPPTRDSNGPAVVTEARDLAGGKWITEAVGTVQRRTFVFPLAWRMPGFHVAMRAGRRLYGSIGSEVAAVEPPAPGGAPRVVWRSRVEGRPLTMLAADGRLVVVTAEGRIYCFGGQTGQPVTHASSPVRPAVGVNRWATSVTQMTEVAGQEPGFALVLGVADGQLVEELLRQSPWHVIVVDADEPKIQSLRRRWDAAGEYGRRLSAVVADPLQLPLPPYLARLVTSEDLASAGLGSRPEFIERVFRTLRPFGGAACWALTPAQQDQLAAWVDRLRLAGASLGRRGDLAVLTRKGAIPGSADWTHEFADAANTRVSLDAHVRGPFGILWFGGPLANRLMFPKQLVPPTPPIVDGRMFVQGPGAIRAVDIYTGTILWTHRFGDDKEDRSVTFAKGDLRVTYRPPTGRDRDYAKIKRVGYNCAAAHDGVYLAVGPECLRLDPATGKVRSRLVIAGDDGRPLYWDSLRVCDDVLLATVVSPDVPLAVTGFSRGEMSRRKEFQEGGIGQNLEVIAANHLVAIDRRTERTVWRRRASQAFAGTQRFWHPWGSQGYQNTSLAAGGGRVFCLDMLPDDVLAAMKRRGFQPSGAGQLLALRIRDGHLLWQQPAQRFCSLAYSQECDVLVSAEASQANYGEGFVGDELIVRNGADGVVLWKARRVDGPVILHHRTIYATAAFSNGTALDLRTGQPKRCAHPLTGEPIPWRCPRAYGCNVPIGGEHLLTFRSATAAYCSLTTDSGTVSLGGFRAGCSNTLIPAGGLLNAPNYAYGCLCNFQNDTSLALVPTPDAEAWGRTALPPITRAVRRLGLNFGAPGDRGDDDGTLWLACDEKLDGPVTVRVEADPVRPFRWHPSRVAGAGPHWVAASGIDGVRKISIDLSPADGPPVRYRVGLYFIEPQAVAAGERVFDIALQGEIATRGFDIVAKAGAVRRAVLCQFEGIPVRGRLEIAFLPHADAKLSYAAVCGLEVRNEARATPTADTPAE